MKTIFDKEAYNEIITRLDKLSPATQSKWGKMNVAQMLAHCKKPIYLPLSDKKHPRILMGVLLGWMFKTKLYNDEPWKQGLPTAPDFIVKDERDFNKEKTELKELIGKLHAAGPSGINPHPHPFFGKFTPAQWGQSAYKHLDHHLKQFGA